MMTPYETQSATLMAERDEPYPKSDPTPKPALTTGDIIFPSEDKVGAAVEAAVDAITDADDEAERDQKRQALLDNLQKLEDASVAREQNVVNNWLEVRASDEIAKQIVDRVNDGESPEEFEPLDTQPIIVRISSTLDTLRDQNTQLAEQFRSVIPEAMSRRSDPANPTGLYTMNDVPYLVKHGIIHDRVALYIDEQQTHIASDETATEEIIARAEPKGYKEAANIFRQRLDAIQGISGLSGAEKRLIASHYEEVISQLEAEIERLTQELEGRDTTIAAQQQEIDEGHIQQWDRQLEQSSLRRKATLFGDVALKALRRLRPTAVRNGES